MVSFTNAKEHEKIVEQEFTINKDGILKIDNKYGNIDIENWDKNKVSFHITITADTWSESKAKKIFRDVEITFPSTGPTKVHARTLLNKVKGRFNIHYKVMAPKDIRIDISNKYGALNIDEVTGDTKIFVKYGSLKANSLGMSSNKPVDVEIKYSSMNVENLNNLKLMMGYGNCTIDNMKDAKIESKYSKFNFGKAQDINVESKYDNYRVNTVRKFNIDSKYTNYKIQKLIGNLDFNSKYGDIDVKSIGNYITSMKIDNEYGNIYINMEEKPYNLSFETSYCRVSYDGKSSKGENNSATGIQVGDSDKTKIRVTSRYGSVTLK